ncbi:PadR family transcriptional regulator [Bariatricus massiliensis]|uniref:PadR family transcriptional regulator n=1 Tax=Bariatricus massiliensis TaxID=1745713 RepID=A0ABS8DMA4_9FIRM|nr:PadR family transcriptional regulator [Bariatricus massiliensis]MCB7306004.1 PadR family transcriptional regulator [Bariatricus massiliensis]MCB7374696.1 PadR family transcriptional regulator [Bariatricus massiliensis]MCB7389147.1 PadR family transcriptional regulator [Bariatricus massiliensis]MCB7413320.1 PadR family transcriptional regulator [Bariatricus massiliensis]MCQ5255218.1 PadR family transcriptional regulator [Bariatricus massiliensis]
MYDKSQLMRGTLEGCILKILSEEVTYGYEIVSRLTMYGFQDIREGTIYPLLVRLEKKGYIISEFRPSPLGPSRKYYEITVEGEQYLKEFILCWEQVEAAMDCIFKREGGKKHEEAE